MTKKAIFIADSLNNAFKFQQILSALDIEVTAGSSQQLARLLRESQGCDLLVYEMGLDSRQGIARVQEALEEGTPRTFLAIVSEEAMPDLKLPGNVRSDFISEDASSAEGMARVMLLLHAEDLAISSEIVQVGDLVLNLATYQVKLGGEPLDLTYLEYALLAFLMTHSGHVYSRDTLLKRVWGFDYYGGSRTVDVHVRRVRAKLGPDLSQRLETVRGVGYLWNSD